MVYNTATHTLHGFTAFTTKEGYAGAMKEVVPAMRVPPAQFARIRWTRMHGKFHPSFR